jgi:hypothetical protein
MEPRTPRPGCAKRMSAAGFSNAPSIHHRSRSHQVYAPSDRIPDMRGIEFEVAWFDVDVIEYRVSCSNGSFCGTTRLYSGHDDLANAADTLSGFPSNAKDSRRVSLGTLDPHCAGGGIEMNFQCIDSAGHAVVLVTLRDDGGKSRGQLQTVSLCIPVEAASIDSFVAEARSVDETMGSKASLHMAGHPDG